MTDNDEESRSPKSSGAAALAIGLVLGALIGAGLMIWGRNLPLVDYLASIPDKLSAGDGLSAGNAPNDQEGHEGHEREAGEGQGEGEVLYWYDPMYPGTRFDKPGKSPFMDMDLVPRYKESSSAAGLVAIDPVTVQNLGLKTAPVKKGRLSITREVAANVEFNRYQEARVQPRAEGFVSQAGALAPGDKIEQGDLIASVTVPAWASDQSEYLLLKSQRADAKLIAGVREKLRLSGMPEDMLSEVDSSGRVQTTYRLLAPVSGVVTELDVYPGMNVDKNMTLAVIQGIDPIWVTAEVPQRDLSLAEGGRIRVTTAAWPERVFEPSSQTLLPRANSQTRTVQLRLTVPNPEGLLRPGLTASVRLRKQSGEALLIPTLSLIDLGDEKRVVTRLPGGAFAPKLVRTGSSSRGETEVLEGLSEGDEVVVSGLFLIDSEANLAGALERLRSPEPAKAADGGASPSSEAAAPMSGEAPKAQEAQEAAPPADSGRAHAHGSG